MTTRLVTELGFGLIILGAVALEMAGRRSGRFSTFGEVLATTLRRLPLRLLLGAAWLWLGWHLFVRVNWR